MPGTEATVLDTARPRQDRASPPNAAHDHSSPGMLTPGAPWGVTAAQIPGTDEQSWAAGVCQTLC